jgi:hypothetical protein
MNRSNPLRWHEPPRDDRTFHQLDRLIQMGRGDLRRPAGPQSPRTRNSTESTAKSTAVVHVDPSLLPARGSSAVVLQIQRLRQIPVGVSVLWHLRCCFVCGARGVCGHRELDVALAELEGMAQGFR